jgi:2-amino-4-hydroxy-6-hydroxymethyldihydropteridine diphosphokinase
MDHDYFIEQVEEDLVLLLGSNLGERFLNLADATARLTEVFGEPTQASKIYETEPWGNKDQPGFLNQALVFRSKFKPMISMEMILEIEIGLGRIREEKWGPRLIDIDIIFTGDSTSLHGRPKLCFRALG